MVEFYLSLKREKGESEIEQKNSVFCKYPGHTCEELIQRK